MTTRPKSRTASAGTESVGAGCVSVSGAGVGVGVDGGGSITLQASPPPASLQGTRYPAAMRPHPGIVLHFETSSPLKQISPLQGSPVHWMHMVSVPAMAGRARQTSTEATVAISPTFSIFLLPPGNISTLVLSASLA